MKLALNLYKCFTSNCDSMVICHELPAGWQWIDEKSGDVFCPYCFDDSQKDEE